MAEKAAHPGDYVEVRTTKKAEEGIVVESYEPGVVLLKLKSGYNIGIPREDIVEIAVKKKAAKKEEKTKKEVKLKKELPKVGMIITGGTISSRLDPETGAVYWLSSPQHLFEIAPEIKDICSISSIERPFMMASENMSSAEWIKIAKTAEKMLNNPEISGIIITHGTDFLHYSAAALSFFLRNLNKPVVLTYSQRSSDRGSSDARLNLICAARAAVSDVAEVMLVGHSGLNDDSCYAFRGTKVRKMHTSRRDTFKAVNEKPIARIYTDKIEYLQEFNARNTGKVELDAVFDDSVALVKFYPGQNPDIFDFYDEKKYNGIIVEVGGLGHVPNGEGRANWLPKLKSKIEKGIVICAVPQTIFGRLDLLVYTPGRELLKTGIIPLDDMLPETAFVKLGWILGHKNITKGKIKEMLLTNYAGEFNPRLGEEFLE